MDNTMLVELSNTQFFSKLFDGWLTVRDFTGNICEFNDSDFTEKRDIFFADLQTIMAMFIAKGCFNEHSFRKARDVFFAICNLPKGETTDQLELT